MLLKEKIQIHLNQIKQLRGVENVVLTQRDRNPIQSTGVWFSKDEIFNVSSATSAIFNVGIYLHPNDLRYILIEGKKAKILIAPLSSSIHNSLNKIIEKQGILNDNNEFFIAITAQPNINLGGIFLQTNECLRKIKSTLITSGETFKPPLIQFNDQKIRNVIDGFNVKEDEHYQSKIFSNSLSFSEITSISLKKTLRDFSRTIPDLVYAFITIDGGFIVSSLVKNIIINNRTLDNVSAMSFSLLQTANRCAWLLKKMRAEHVLLDCEKSFQFINGLENGLFSAKIAKSKQKLGLLRLIIPQFSRKINELISDASKIQDHRSFDVKKLLGELIIN